MRKPCGRDCRLRPNKPAERTAFIRKIKGVMPCDEALVFIENRDASASKHFLECGYSGRQLQPVCTPGPGKANNCTGPATRMLKENGACTRLWNNPSKVWLDPWTASSSALSQFTCARAVRVWLDLCCRVDSPDVKPLLLVRACFVKYGPRLRVMDINLSLRGVHTSQWLTVQSMLNRAVSDAAADVGLVCTPHILYDYRARIGGSPMIRACFNLTPRTTWAQWFRNLLF